MGTPQHIRHLGIRIYKPLLYIHHEEDNICGINSYLSLFPHLRQDNVTAVRLYSAGIYQGKGPIQPGHIRINTIPGNPGRILYDGDHLSCQSVKKGGFSHVRSSHHRYNWFSRCITHIFFPSILLIKALTKSYPLDFTISVFTCKAPDRSRTVISSSKTCSPLLNIFSGKYRISPNSCPLSCAIISCPVSSPVTVDFFPRKIIPYRINMD